MTTRVLLKLQQNCALFAIAALACSSAALRLEPERAIAQPFIQFAPPPDALALLDLEGMAGDARGGVLFAARARFASRRSTSTALLLASLHRAPVG
jgi:hypothetical protein